MFSDSLSVNSQILPESGILWSVKRNLKPYKNREGLNVLYTTIKISRTVISTISMLLNLEIFWIQPKETNSSFRKKIYKEFVKENKINFAKNLNETFTSKKINIVVYKKSQDHRERWKEKKKDEAEVRKKHLELLKSKKRKEELRLVAPGRGYSFFFLSLNQLKQKSRRNISYLALSLQVYLQISRMIDPRDQTNRKVLLNGKNLNNICCSFFFNINGNWYIFLSRNILH